MACEKFRQWLVFPNSDKTFADFYFTLSEIAKLISLLCPKKLNFRTCIDKIGKHFSMAKIFVYTALIYILGVTGYITMAFDQIGAYAHTLVNSMIVQQWSTC